MAAPVGAPAIEASPVPRLLPPLLLSCLLGLLAYLLWPTPVQAPPPPDGPKASTPLLQLLPAKRALATTDEDALAQMVRQPTAPAPPPSAGDARARLRALVLRRGQDGALAPVPDLEVTVGPQIVVDALRDEQRAVTDAQGAVEFEVPPGDRIVRLPNGDRRAASLLPAASVEVRFELEAGPQVRGIVLDDRGAPASGAAVMMTAAGSPRRLQQVARTAADGAFVAFAVRPAAALRAVHLDFAPSDAVPIAAHLGADGPTMTLRLRAHFGRIRGAVADSLQRPVPHAIVAFEETPPGGDGEAAQIALQEVRADALGRFVSPPLVPGTVLVHAQAPGPARGPAPASAQAIVRPGELCDLRLQLPGGASLRGQVRREDGAPAAFSAVLVGRRGSPGSRLARADEEGRYELQELPPGIVPVLALGLASDGSTTQFAHAEVELADGAWTTWDPQLAAPARLQLQGRVTSQFGEGLAGWHVSATPSGSRRGVATTTGPDGSFVLERLPQATAARIRVRRPQDGPQGFPVATAGPVEPGGPPLEIVVVDPPADRGTIVLTALGDDGRPAAAELHLRDEAGQGAVFAAASDGRIVALMAPAGVLRAELRTRGAPPLRLPPIEVQAQQTTDLGVLDLRTRGYVQGRLLGPDDAPATDATVRILDAGTRDLGLCEPTADGYRSPRLEPGSYALLVQARSLAPARIPIQLRAGDAQILDIRLRPGTLQRVLVRTGADGPRDGTVSLVLQDAQQQPVFAAHLPLVGGAAEFEAWLPDGAFAAVALGPRGGTATGRVQVAAAAGPGRCELTLSR